jgi:hypothetical protein
MATTIEITDAGLMPDLVNALARSGCAVDWTTGTACRVAHLNAGSPDEEALEIAFFVRAWQLRHPHVDARIAR